MNDSVQIGRHILGLAAKRDMKLTPLQLIKLTYLAHSWMLGLYGKPLAEDDVEAWPLGPVFRRLYHKVKDFRDQPIESLEVPHKAKFSEEEESVIRQTFDVYGKKSGIFLSALTHDKGTPWTETWDRYGKNAVIPQDLIERHFKEKAERNVA